MSTPVRVHRTHVPCATSTPLRSLGPAGVCGYVYTFAELAADSLGHLSRLDYKKACGRAPVSLVIGGGGAGVREAGPALPLDLSNKHFGTSKEF